MLGGQMNIRRGFSLQAPLLGVLILLNALMPAMATPQCQAVLCLSPGPEGPPAECQSIRAPYFQIQIYTPVYNPPATALARQQYLMSGCGQMAAQIAVITQKYGQLMVDPGN